MFKSNWTGYPTTDPAIVINGTSIYVSWNGATEVATWNLLGSNDGSTVTSLLNTTTAGFETMVTIPTGTTYTYYQMAALTKENTVLGYSSFSGTNGQTLAVSPAESSSVSTYATTTMASTGTGTGSASSGVVTATATVAAASKSSSAERGMRIWTGLVSLAFAVVAIWGVI